MCSIKPLDGLELPSTILGDKTALPSLEGFSLEFLDRKVEDFAFYWDSAESSRERAGIDDAFNFLLRKRGLPPKTREEYLARYEQAKSALSSDPLPDRRTSYQEASIV